MTLLGTLLLLPTVAVAQQRSRPPAAPLDGDELRRAASAAESKKRGDELLSAKRFEEALAEYEQSYRLSANPALHYNRGRVLQFLARYPEALKAIQRFDADAPPELKARVPGLPGLIEDLRRLVSTVDVRCAVPGARIVVEKRVLATTPLDGPLVVNAGAVVIEVFAEGYFPFHRALTLPGGGTTTLDVRLASRDTMGYLVVTSTVAGARVKVGGKSIGTVPTEVALPKGGYPVLVEHEGYEPLTTQVVLASGERRDLSIPLQKTRPLVSRWWFWASIGAIAVTTAVVTGVVISRTERDPPTGDFSPGQIRF
ncbi:MAG: PEGA domain-containing protein [Polyangiaceae bacterium]|nr:PEGA domain-containing protein [Polyangiaceae bacterium]